MLHPAGLGIVYVFLIISVAMQAYSLRLRHCVAGYFYPEREKDRIKQLHRDLLRQKAVEMKEFKVSFEGHGQNICVF